MFRRPFKTIWFSRLTRVCLAPAVFVLAGSASVSAQINTGSIVGAVTDQNGAVAPNAEVTLTHVELRTVFKATTDSNGSYVATNLQPGPYEIRVVAQGFQTALRSNIVLRVRDQLRVDIALTPGQISERVSITDAAPVLETQSADVGAVVEQKRIVDLPLDGRRYSDLILLAPGAVPAPGSGNPREARLNVNGNFSLQNYFALNGVDNNSFSTNAQERSPQVAQPPPDALREFKVQTRTYSAEFGWFQGAIVNAETRSGSNEVHGALWWFHRNDNLDANSFFANAAGVERGEFLRNQAGVAVGGPLIQDKTFWFGDYNFLRSRKAQTGVGTVPTAAMRTGDFSARSVLSTPASIPQIAPCITGNNQLNLNAMRTDGRVCGDPAGLKLVDLYPLPNAPAISPFAFVANQNIPVENDSFDIRLDQRIGENNTISGTYNYFNERAVIERGPLPDPLATGGFSANSKIKGQVLSLSWNRVFSSNLLNDARLGFNRITSNSQPLAPKGSAAAQFDIIGAPDNDFVFGLPFISVSGYNILGTSGWRPQFQVSQVYQFMDNLAYIRGDHSFKVGFEYKRLINNFLDVRAPHGEIAFPNFWAGDGVANLLLGLVQRQNTTTPHVVHNYINGYMGYGQDSWRVANNFTLTYGVRYEYFTPFIERDRLTTNFDPSANGGRGGLVTAAPNTFDPIQPVSGDGLFARTLVNPDRNNFAPRVGFAWNPGSRVVLRGGFGIFYQVMDRIGSESVLQLNPPHVIDTSVSVGTSSMPLFFLRDGFLPPPTSVDPRLLQIRARDFNETAPYSQQVSFGPQFQLMDDLSIDVSFVGNYSRDIRKLRNINQGILSGGSVTFPYPDFCLNPAAANCAFIQQLASDGIANYNSLQVTVNRRFAKGLAFNAAYTLGKGLGNVTDNLSTNGGFGSTPQNAHDLDADYGRLVFDQRHRFVFNWVWELPFGSNQPYLQSGPGALLLGGWQFNGIVSSTSGAPLTFTGGNVSNTGGGHQSRANCIGNPRPSGFEPTLDAAFDKSAFANPSAFTFGSCGVGTLSGWANHNWDLSLFRKFNFDETRYFEFRVEFFNAFNTPQFASPTTSVTSGNFGRTTGLRNDDRAAREIQFGLKFYF